MERLEALVSQIASLEMEVKAELLLEYAERFKGIPPDVLCRPYPQNLLVPGCESEAYIFTRPNEDGTLKFYFAVENPHGVSAQALSVLLDETLSGTSLQQIAAIREDLVYDIFGKGLSMGKGQGLMSMVAMVKQHAKNALKNTN